MTRVGRWAHPRRLWIKAEKLDPSISRWFLRTIGRAFLVERILKARREAMGLDDGAFHELRHEVRDRVTRRILDAIERRRHDLVTGEMPPLSKSPTGKALTYLASQGESLRNVLLSGEVELDNNASERDLRHAVIGRKNWQMTSEDRGAKVMARLFSVMVSCKAAGIHPEAYLRDVLPRLATTPSSELASLTPWAWAEAQSETAQTHRD